MGCNRIVRAAACIVAVALSSYSFAQEGRAIYNKSVFHNYKNLPVNNIAAGKTVKNVKSVFPGWVATTDKVDGRFTDIYGTPVSLAGGTTKAMAESCLSEQLATLGLQKNEWKLVSDIKAPKADYVNYTREIGGHTVVFSTLSFRFTKAGTLARVQVKNFGTAANIVPVLTADDAKQAVTRDLAEFSNVVISSTEINPNWYWFPVPSAKGYELRPAWRFAVTGKDDRNMPVKLTGYADAITGATLYRTNEVKETGYDMTVKGMVYKNGLANPATLEPLTELELQIGAGTYFTDTAGKFTDALLGLPQSTTIPLRGRWSTVVDIPSGVTPVFINLVSLPGTTYTYPATAPASSRHINAYYHVNRVHEYMAPRMPGFTDMDISLITNVDVNGTCNAYYTGSDINFYKAGGGCASFADIGDVVYHEYGHGISDKFYTWVSGVTLNNGALHEANSDIWGMAISHDPVLARNAFTSGGFIRKYDGIPQVYPLDLEGIDPHKDGQIIAGCWWDAGVNIGNVDTMAALFASVYYDHPDAPDGMEGPLFQEILVDALIADDNDGNLFNGTPHYAAIVAAFARHGIYLGGELVLTHNELPRQPAGTPINVTAVLNVTTSDYFHDLTLYYRINNTGAWTPVSMANTSPLTGTIPAQDAGTVVEYYFAVHDSINVANAYFPIACNPALPAAWSNTPYQFGVGISAKDSMDFNTTTAGWGVGNNPGDNATAGLWALDVPFGTYDVWPMGDHSTGFNSCLMTGNEADTSGVKRGASTVLSPIYDISGFTTPVVEYYRWISNERKLRNFKNDPWVVKIKDAAAANWITVENTYQGDRSWRRRIFPVSAYLPAGTATIQLKFFASDSLINTLRSSGQSTSVNCLDDVYIYDKAPVGIKEATAVKATIFPVPADDMVKVVMSAGVKGIIKLYNTTGQVVAATAMEQGRNTYSINTAALAAGSYNLVIQTDNSIQSKKIVILHQ